MLTYEDDDRAKRQGLDLIVSLTADQRDALDTDAAILGELFDTTLIGLAAFRMGHDPEVPAGTMSMKDHPVTADQAWDHWLIRDTTMLIDRLTGIRAAAIRAHANHGGSYGALAQAMGLPTEKRSTAQRRRETVMNSTPDDMEIWATGRIYTAPSVIEGVAAGASWADPEMDPARIDWTARQAAALIPFRVVDGRPVAPAAPTGIRYGRNELGHWGERVCADAVVIATDEHGRRWLVMVERSDGHGWALPGGHVDPGETPAAAAVRELGEETGLLLCPEDGVTWQAMSTRYVPDPRGSDEAWMVTVPALTRLPVCPRTDFPTLAGADDAKRAAWVAADDYATVTHYLTQTYGPDAVVFSAHQAILAEVLD